MARETDALLGGSPLPVTPKFSTTWSNVSVFGKLLLLGGIAGAATSGWAVASTVVPYAQALDAMARGTLDGTDEVLRAYIRLVVIDVGARFFQFLSFSWVAKSHVRRLKLSNALDHEAFITRLGTIFFHTGLYLTALVATIQFGWKFAWFVLLCAAVLIAATIVGAIWFSFSLLQNGLNSSSSLKLLVNEVLLQQFVSKFWTRARGYKMINAANFVMAKLEDFFRERHLTRGVVAFLPIITRLPSVVVFLYMGWKIRSADVHPTEFSELAISMVIVYIAGTAASKSAEIVRESVALKGANPAETNPDRAKAIEWVTAFAKPYEPSIALRGFKAVVTTALSSVWFFVTAYAVAWLFTLQYSATVSFGLWQIAGVMLAGIVVYGLVQEFWVRGELHTSAEITEAIVMETISQRLNTDVDDQTKWPEVDGDSVMVMASVVSLAGVGQLPRSEYSALIGALAGVAIALTVEPIYGTAVVIERLLSYSSSVWQGLQVRGVHVPGAQSWFILSTIEAAFTTIAYGVERAALVALLYAQLRLVAQGPSTLFTTLAVEWFIRHCVTFVETRGALSVAFDESCVGAANQLKSIIGDDHQELQTVEIDLFVASSAKLSGDLSLELAVENRTRSIRVGAGELSVVEVSEASDVAKITSSIMRLSRTSVVNKATVGQTRLADVPTLQLHDHIMVIAREPLTVPGTLRDNLKLVRPTAADTTVEAVAKQAGFNAEELNTNDFSDSSKLLVAQVVLRDPDVVVVEDHENSGDVDAVAAVKQIRQQLPACKVLVLTSKRERWTGGGDREPEKEAATIA